MKWDFLPGKSFSLSKKAQIILFELMKGCLGWTHRIWERHFAPLSEREAVSAGSRSRGVFGIWPQEQPLSFWGSGDLLECFLGTCGSQWLCGFFPSGFRATTGFFLFALLQTVRFPWPIPFADQCRPLCVVLTPKSTGWGFDFFLPPYLNLGVRPLWFRKLFSFWVFTESYLSY